jgi:hypothetical protein
LPIFINQHRFVLIPSSCVFLCVAGVRHFLLFWGCTSIYSALRLCFVILVSSHSPQVFLCFASTQCDSRLKTFRPPGALGDAPVAAAPHPNTFRPKPGTCWDRFCDGREAVVSAQLSRCGAIHQSISPHYKLSPDKGLDYFAILVA